MIARKIREQITGPLPMRKFAALSLVALLAACGTGGGGTVQVTSQDLSYIQPGISGSFETDLNALRASRGLAPVRANAKLSSAAAKHAEDMVRRGYFSHVSADGPNGRTMTDRISAERYLACAAAENIAYGQSTEAQVFTGWVNSPGHLANMVRGRYSEYGLGRFQNHWVLLLADPC